MSSNPLSKVLLWSTNMQRNEVKATVAAFSFVFILMAAYYLLRPVRDAMASDWTDAEVAWLWTLNFFISTAIVAAYGVLVSRIQFKRLVPSVYLFFAASFIAFYVLTQSVADRDLVDKAFYVWVSVFALFHVSVFWSFMADTFNKEQAGRLFSVITAGASVGAIAGPLLSAQLVSSVGIDGMLLVSAVFLLFPIPLIGFLRQQKETELGNAELSISEEKAMQGGKLGGNPFKGFIAFVTNPYLLGIGVFIILYTGIGSFVYFELKNLLAEYSREQRTEIYAYRDAISNAITFVMAFFLTGRVVTKLGMPTALALVPLLLMLGMLVLAFSPVLLVALAVWVARSAGNYGLARPAREMLFTHVSAEDRFKTKPVIDIVAYRGGDVIMGWLFAFLTGGLGLGLAAVALVGAGIAALWAIVGVWLGRQFQNNQQNLDQASD